MACDKGYMWNPSTYSFKCDRYCETGQYLDYNNCVCRKKIIDDLIEQCTSIVDMYIKTILYKKRVMNHLVIFILFYLTYF